MTLIQLDPHRLLGFRLEARDAVAFDRSGSTTATKRGVKTGVKPGTKPDRIDNKVGAKIGIKPDLSV